MEHELPQESVLTPVPASPAVPAPPVPDVAPYQDRSTGLLLFGIVQIILGCLTGLAVPLVLLSALVASSTPGGHMRPSQAVFAGAGYGLLAIAFVTLGLGSVRTRRWARALTLVFSWYGMIIGILITVLLTAVLPVAMRGVLRAQHDAATVPSADVSTGVMAVIVTFIIIGCAFFFVVVPIAFIAFYSRKDVEQTCRDRDPVERWTDRAPLPVLAASVVFGAGSGYFLLLSFTTPLFPFFGRYLTGVAGSAGMLALAALDVYLAIALFRLKASGWWLAVITMVVRTVSMILTYARGNLLQAYSKMGWSDSQLQAVNSNPVLRSHVILWWSLLSMVVFLGYLMWLKRYFVAKMAPVEQGPAVSGQVG